MFDFGDQFSGFFYKYIKVSSKLVCFKKYFALYLISYFEFKTKLRYCHVIDFLSNFIVGFFFFYLAAENSLYVNRGYLKYIVISLWLYSFFAAPRKSRPLSASRKQRQNDSTISSDASVEIANAILEENRKIEVKQSGEFLINCLSF